MVSEAASLYTCVFHQRGQSAEMLALWRSRKRLGFLILCKGATEKYKMPLAILLSHSIFNESPNFRYTFESNAVLSKKKLIYIPRRDTIQFIFAQEVF